MDFFENIIWLKCIQGKKPKPKNINKLRLWIDIHFEWYKLIYFHLPTRVLF